MKIIRLALILLIAPFLNGCFSMVAINKTKYPDPKVLHDRIHHIEMAGISTNNELLIFLEGSLSNTPINSRFTIGIPLAEKEYPNDFHFGTNTFLVTSRNIQRAAIRNGWPAADATNNLEIVPVGLPISPQDVYGNGFAEYGTGALAKPVPNSNRALYQVRLSDQMEFIYVADSNKKAYTDLQVVQALHYPKRADRYYLLLPITVPLDIATSPIQVPLFIYIYISIKTHGIGC